MKTFMPNEKVHVNGRAFWVKAMAEIGAKNDKVVALSADLSRSVCTEEFRKAYPGRFFNAGIAEQNMIGVAAGLAMTGWIPYCATFAPFNSMRAIEQFRTDVCYMNLNVRMVSCYGGISGGVGPTHSGLEDAGIVRGLARSAIVCASDTGMVKKIFEASVSYKGPLYIRLGEGANDPELYAEDYEFQIGKALLTRPGKDAAIISFGATLRYALAAAETLAGEGIDVRVVDMHTLKPLDAQAVLDAARQTGGIVTMEDHSILNGLGSAVAETLMEHGAFCKFKRLGIPDLYPCYGPTAALHKKYGYDAAAAVKAVKEVLR